MTKEQQKFIEDVAKFVQKYAAQYGITVHSPIIAQAILESGWGKSKLASTYFNYFGMKCGSKWTGKSVNMKTMEEYTKGTLTQIQDNFRVYESMEDGVKGYFEFIQASRYANLKGITDPQKYLETIKADGYATSSAYVENNMKVVNTYGLTAYDRKVNNMSILRSKMVKQMQSWIGCKESDGSYKKIIDIYNSQKKLPRGYKVKYNDAWCATTVSAAAVACGYDGVIPTECSCNQLIKLFQGKKQWMENDAYVPEPGDFIFYDWDDNGVGDDTGASEHVGMVEKVSGNDITVIEGNKNNACGRRTLKVNGRYIRGYGLPAYDKETSKPVEPSPQPEKKPATTSKEVKAKCAAINMSKDMAGTYTVNASSLNMRHGAGTKYDVMTVLPKGTKVKNYGYYSNASDKSVWLYVQVTLNGVTYTGFCSKKYLSK